MIKDQMRVVRYWLKIALEPLRDEGLDLFADFDADTRVINEPFKGPRGRPSGPFLSLQMLVYNQPVSSIGDPGYHHDQPNQMVQSTIRVQAFGAAAIDWLDTAVGLVYSPDLIDKINKLYNTDLGFGLVRDPPEYYTLELAATGGVATLPAELLDVDHELRGYTDVFVGCRRIVERVTPEAKTIIIDPFTVEHPDYSISVGPGTVDLNEEP